MISKRDFLLGLIVIFIWAGHTIVIKLITNQFEPVTALSLRLVFTGLLFAPFFRWPGKEKFSLLCQISFLMAVVHWGTLFWAMEYLDASTAMILMQTQTIFSVIWGIVLFKEKIGWRTTLGIFIGMMGVVVLLGMPEHPPSIKGSIIIIFSMLAVSLCYARMKKLSGVSAINYLAHMNILAILPVIPAMFLFEKPLDIDWGALDYAPLIPAFLYQVILVSISHIIWQRLLTRNDMSILPNMTLLIPFIGILAAMVILDETLTWPMVAGGLITMAGVGIIMIRKSQKGIRTGNLEL